MVVHIVMWKFKDDVDGNAAYKELKPLLEGLTGKIPGLESLELGLNFNDDEAAWDLVLRSVHKDKKALEAYQVHPEHVLAAKQVAAVVKARAVVDFAH